MTPAALASIAPAANSAPSNRSPRIAMNSSPAPIVRVSIDTPRNSARLVARDDRPARRRSHPGCGQGNPVHITPAPREVDGPEFVPRRASASRATATSSNGSVRSPITWHSRDPCPRSARDRRAWPLRSLSRSPRADRRSSGVGPRPCGVLIVMPRRTSSMITLQDPRCAGCRR